MCCHTVGFDNLIAPYDLTPQIPWRAAMNAFARLLGIEDEDKEKVDGEANKRH